MTEGCLNEYIEYKYKAKGIGVYTKSRPQGQNNK